MKTGGRSSLYEEGGTPQNNGPKKKSNIPPDPRAPYWHWSDMFVGIDMFGVRPTLEISGKRKYKSCWGAFISFITILAILVFIFFQVLQIQKMDPAGQTFVADIQDALPNFFYVSYDKKHMQSLKKYQEYRRERAELLEKLELQMLRQMNQNGRLLQGLSVDDIDYILPPVKLTAGAQAILDQMKAFETVDTIRNTLITRILDACALTGGFIYFARFFFSFLAQCVNRKLYTKQVLTDSYMVGLNDHYLCQRDGFSTEKKKKNGSGGGSTGQSLKKKKPEFENQNADPTRNGSTKRSANLELIPEEEGEDRSNYESHGNMASLREGGSLGLSKSSSSTVVQDDYVLSPTKEVNAKLEASDPTIENLPALLSHRTPIKNSLLVVEDEEINHMQDKESLVFQEVMPESCSYESGDSAENIDGTNDDQVVIEMQDFKMSDYNSITPMMMDKVEKQNSSVELEGGANYASYSRASTRNRGFSNGSGSYYKEEGGSHRSRNSALSPRESQRSGGRGQPVPSQRSATSKQSVAKSQGGQSEKSGKSANKSLSGTSSRGSEIYNSLGYKPAPKSSFLKINVSGWQVFRLQITPYCCRTKYQKAVARMFKKGELKLHREMDVGYLLKNIRDARHSVRSYAQSKCFTPPQLMKAYQTHYVNTLNISMKTQESIEKEYDDPIPIDYMEPRPTCVCPDLGEENMFKITTAALDTLRAETQLMGMLEEQKKRKASHEGGNSDKRSRRSGMGSIHSGKIKSDDIIDRSTKKGKNDPVSIMHPQGDDGDIVSPRSAKDPVQATNKQSESAAEQSRKSNQVTNRGKSPVPSSRKSSKSPGPAADKDKKKDKKEKKEKKDKEKDKKKKKDKDDKMRRKSTIKDQKKDDGQETTQQATEEQAPKPTGEGGETSKE